LTFDSKRFKRNYLTKARNDTMNDEGFRAGIALAIQAARSKWFAVLFVEATGYTAPIGKGFDLQDLHNWFSARGSHDA
jgi:hypothetical protein